MKKAQLFHNPGAGNELYNKEELISLIEANGFECRYSSTKDKAWKDIDKDIEFLIIAGGDGTVRDVTEILLDRKILSRTWPIGLLPLGTANNIAKTLKITGGTEQIIQSWHNPKIKKFDVGRIFKVSETKFFLESYGYGIFPFLMMKMKEKDKNETDTSEHRIGLALEELHEIALSYEPRYCKLNVDGTDHSGKFLLVEIMNTRSIGPNLLLDPLADPGDGELEVVMVPENHKKRFAAYIDDKLKGAEETYAFHTLKASDKISINWDGTHVHIDDEIIKLDDDQNVKIELKEGVLEFLVSSE
jgi:diacylglycerol kinase family enzyme